MSAQIPMSRPAGQPPRITINGIGPTQRRRGKLKKE
jgi:hypothetical protein